MPHHDALTINHTLTIGDASRLKCASSTQFEARVRLGKGVRGTLVRRDINLACMYYTNENAIPSNDAETERGLSS